MCKHITTHVPTHTHTQQKMLAYCALTCTHNNTESLSCHSFKPETPNKYCNVPNH